MGFVVCETTPTCMLGVYPTCKTLVSNPCSNLKWGIKYRKSGIVLQTLCRTTQTLQSPASPDILGCLRHFTNKLIPTFSYKVHQFRNAPNGAFFVWFSLPAKYIIHAVGPDYTEWEPETAEALLADTYKSIMQIVAQNPDTTTIAIPAISCGIFAFPLERATEIAINTIKAKIPPHLKQVQFIVSNNNIASVYSEQMNK